MTDSTPCTGREAPLPEGFILVSRTDLRGVITMANEAFVEASGYSRAELLGKPHNLVRHPDMPAAAFADLWSTLRAGQSWVGVVKNRCKNGDHYWVRANVTPEISDGRLSGYISVRVAPTRAEVEAAETAYRHIQGGGTALGVHRGRLRRTGWHAGLVRAFSSLRVQLIATLAGILVLCVAGGAVATQGIRTAIRGSETMYADRLVAAVQLGEILVQMAGAGDDLDAVLARGSEPRPAGERLANRRTEIMHLLDAYLHTELTAEEEPLARQLAGHFGRWDELVLAPAAGAFAGGRSDGMGERRTGALGAEQGTLATIHELLALQQRAGREVLDQQHGDLARHAAWAAACLGAAALLALLLALLQPWIISRRLTGIHGTLDEIARGNWNRPIDLDGRDEFQPTFLGLAVLQTKLAYAQLSQLDQRRVMVHDFDASVGQVLGTVRDSVERLQDTALRQNQVANTVSESAQAVSAASSEMEASIRSIADQAGQVRELARQVSAAADHSRGTMASLASATGEITAVARLIGRIADQTSLLALNATIESASAGEAGRGFAVVANEVKGLSGRTRDATGSIGARIEAIQRDSQAAVKALDDLAGQIRQLSESSATIAAAVEQQTRATDAIAQTAGRTSAGAADTDAAAKAVAEAGAVLAQSTTALDRALANFKANI